MSQCSHSDSAIKHSVKDHKLCNVVQQTAATKKQLHTTDNSALATTSGTYRADQRVEHAHGEGGPAGERLRQVQLGVRIIVVILVEELHVRVVDCGCGNEQNMNSSPSFV